MAKKVYFAHCMADYGNAREQIALALIRERFPGHVIINPNDPVYQDAFERKRQSLGLHPMNFWLDLVDDADIVVFLYSGDEMADFYLGAGVAQEVLRAHVFDKPVFQVKVVLTSTGALQCSLDQSVVFQDVLSISETRHLIAQNAEDAAMMEEHDVVV